MKRTEHLLVILMEECAEVAQAASKALRFGLQDREPGQEKTNAVRIAEEFADLKAVVTMLRWEEGDHLPQLDNEHSLIVQKERKVEHFLAYSAECGTLSPAVESIPATEEQQP